MATAVESSKSWFLSVGPPGSFHSLLDTAMKDTKSSPTVLVVDNPNECNWDAVMRGKADKQEKGNMSAKDRKTSSTRFRDM